MLMSGRDVHVDALLTNLVVGYSNPAYIADTIFPIVPVAKQGDLFLVFDQSAWFRDEAKLRAPGTKSEGGSWGTSKDNYFAVRYSYRTEIPDEVRDNADASFNLDSNAATFVMDKIGMRKEISWANDFFKTGVWASDKVGGVDFTKWSDYSASLPFPDLTTYADDMEGRIGFEPNTVVMGKRVWSKLRWHPDLIETIKYTQRAIVGEDLFSAATGLGRVLIGKSLYTTDPEGTAEASVTYNRIWGDNVLLMYVAPNAGIMTPSAGYTFTWRRVPNSIAYILRHRDDQSEIDIIEGNTYYDQKVTASRAGIFLSGAI